MEEIVEPEVIIVGGGLAGLFAAHLLEQNRTSYLLLEAKSVLGGRILSEPHPGADLGIDLGPTWFWDHQPRIGKLLKTLGLPVFKQYTQGDTFYQLGPNQLHRVQGQGAPISYRLRGGMTSLIRALSADLPKKNILLDHAVTSAFKDGDVWVVQADASNRKSFQARHVMLAAPPRIIARDINFGGSLSAELLIDLENTPTWMAGQAKFIATYDQPFWREQGLAGQAFSRVGPMVEIHDASAWDDSGFALFGFLGWPAPTRRSMSSEDLENKCLQQLANIFGPKAAETLGFRLKDWALDMRTATERDAREPSVHPEFQMVPFQKELQSLNLHLITSEFASQEAGYLEGSILAAEQGVMTMLRNR